MKANSSADSVRFQRLRAIRVRVQAGKRALLYKGPGPEHGVAGSAASGSEFVAYEIDVGRDGKAYYVIANGRAWIASEDVYDITDEIFVRRSTWETAFSYLLSGVIIVLGIMIVVAAIYLLAR